MNPYASLPETAFWDKSVASLGGYELDPVGEVPFQLVATDKIATAGSCFAQHIARHLTKKGFNYFITEYEDKIGAENYGVFPARFGNIYTVRQLLQLFDRAYGLFVPVDEFWMRTDGAYVDPFRPRIQTKGFASLAELLEDRQRHLGSVRKMFERCDVFIFTLGLTEGWKSSIDGAVFPLAPGVAGGTLDDRYKFHNFLVNEMVDDFNQFIRKLQSVNPSVKIVLTVSPVPLKATYEKRHVFLSNTYSKAALRVAAETLSLANAFVYYFPSYEIITSNGSAFYESDRRTVTRRGVETVMSIFDLHLMANEGISASLEVALPGHLGLDPVCPSTRKPTKFEELSQIICDEEALGDL